jgi:hypothetical protein
LGQLATFRRDRLANLRETLRDGPRSRGAEREIPLDPNAPERYMKSNAWYLAALIPVGLLASQGAFSAQIAVLGVTLGIFFGTLSLRKPTPGDATNTNPGH